MRVFRSVLCLLTAIIVTFVGILLLKNGIVAGSLDCSDLDFPCEDGGCVDAAFWCDSHEDCSDGSDEKYCKESTPSNNNPNKCPSVYFKCNNGPCIPIIGKCDGYPNCDDASDEDNCEQTDSSSESGTSSPSLVPMAPTLGFPTTAATEFEIYIPTTTHQSQVKKEFDLTYEFLEQQEKARNWLLSQRNSDFGWGKETPRALTALYLSDKQWRMKMNESYLLMIKQLELQLFLDLSRNGTKPMKLADFALYINALLVSCKDPNNFHGENLVQTLRKGVEFAQKESTFVNPSIYLTLCLAEASTYNDTRKLQDIIMNSSIARIDTQALAALAITCINRNMDLLNISVYNSLIKEFILRLNGSAIPGNVYRATLLHQVLQELKVTLTGLKEFILKQQQEDGSFGGILATYLALPVLSGRGFLHMNKHCIQRSSTGLTPIEVLKNTKRRKIYVQYSLNFGNPVEVTETIQMQVAEGINFLDVMRLAQEISPKFKFMLDSNREVPVVYSIGGEPNDAEKGKFWILYLAKGEEKKLAPYTGNIKELIPQAGEEFVFWMKRL